MSILRRIQNGETGALGQPSNGNGETPAAAPAAPVAPRKITTSLSSNNQDTYQDLKARVQAKLVGCSLTLHGRHSCR